jgi:hypothetical protein
LMWSCQAILSGWKEMENQNREMRGWTKGKV